MKTKAEKSSFSRTRNSETKRLKELYMPVMDKKDYDRCLRLIEQMAWLSTSISELQKKIENDGTKIEYQNGANQWGEKANPDVDILNRYSSQYRDTKKSIDAMVKVDMADEDELSKWRNNR